MVLLVSLFHGCSWSSCYSNESILLSMAQCQYILDLSFAFAMGWILWCILLLTIIGNNSAIRKDQYILGLDWWDVPAPLHTPSLIVLFSHDQYLWNSRICWRGTPIILTQAVMCIFVNIGASVQLCDVAIFTPLPCILGGGPRDAYVDHMIYSLPSVSRASVPYLSPVRLYLPCQSIVVDYLNIISCCCLWLVLWICWR